MGPHMYHQPGNMIFAIVGLVYINLQPEYELSSTRFGQFRKFGKIKVGGPSSPATPKEIFSARGPSSCSWLPASQI